jgi:hypothetical protein
MGTRTPTLLALLLIAVALLGCGGSDGSGDNDGGESLTKAEFVKRANAICRQVGAGLAQRTAKFKRLRAGMKPEPYVDDIHYVLLPVREEELWKIEGIGTPAGEKERLRVLFAAERTAIDAVAVIPNVASTAVVEQHFVRPGKMFRAYGLSSCAHGDRL